MKVNDFFFNYKRSKWEAKKNEVFVFILKRAQHQRRSNNELLQLQLWFGARILLKYI